MESTKKIAVIGAGAAGLTSIKTCKEEGFDVVCFEKTNYIGGLWRYHEDDVDGIASVMKSTIINSSKEMSAFSDFPPPKEFPNYMHNKMMVRYLEMYAEHFEVMEHIRFRQEILKLEMAEDYQETGRWKLTIRDIEKDEKYEEEFDGVMICTGHHVKPYQPTFPGQSEFKGKIMHSHSYKKPNGFEDKKVVVVGIGNSGGDIAVELSSISDKVYVSTRSGSWIIHRVGPTGYPMDLTYLRRIWYLLYQILPYEFCCSIAEKAMNAERFHHRAYRLQPKHRIFGQHPMTNDALPNRILSGTVTIKGNINRFTPNGVIFEDDDKEYDVDEVIMATGYLMEFPFLDEKLQLNFKNNRVEFYMHMFPPYFDHPSLCFIGLFQSIGAIFGLAEAQARWFTALMSNAVTFPPLQQRLNDIKAKANEMSSRYYDSLRHVNQVDWVPFMDQIYSMIGAKPNLSKLLLADPALFIRCLFGPCVTYQYRLNGPHAWSGARDAIMTVKERALGALKTAEPKIYKKTPRKRQFAKVKFLISLILLWVVISKLIDIML